MTENALTAAIDTDIIEKVVIGGDLSKLTAQQRMDYYSAICNSLGLNPLTRPFDYLNLHGKLVLYAKRDAADQLRKIHSISIDKPEVTISDDLVMVAVTGRDKTGRTDSELGVVYLGKKAGDDKANAILKAITKAKRRLTLSIVGLGWLDETEVETIPNAQTVYPPEHAAMIDERAEQAEAQRELNDLGLAPHWIKDSKVRARFWAWTGGTLGLDSEQVHAALGVEHIEDYAGTKDEAKTAILNWNAARKEAESE